MLNFGYNFGLGYTKENYIEHLIQKTPAATKEFMSIKISGLVSVKISEKIFIQLVPALLWTDPANSLRTPNKWYIAGEGLSFLTQLGFVYSLK